MGIVKILDIKEVKKFLLIFYCVAVIGFLIPVTYPYFKLLTPLALLMNVLLLINFHENWSTKFILLSFFILLASFFAEVIGVNTGFFFGNYTYGKILGPKLFNTPIIIAFNWIMLVYCIYIIICMLNIHTILQIITGALMLVIFDIVLEPSAINLGMWSWDNNHIPLSNSITWFILSLIFLSVFKIFKITIKNNIALYILLYQFGLFIILLLFFYFV